MVWLVLLMVLPLSAGQPIQPAAQCQMHIEGTPGTEEGWPLGQVRLAEGSCKGGPVVLGMHAQLLNSSRHHFQGVSWSQGCAMHGCLITICGQTRVVIANSTISGVNDDSESEHLKKIKSAGSMFRVVCVRDAAHVTFHHTVIRGNMASAIVAFNASRVVLRASKVLHNVGFLHAGGLSAADSAHVVVTDGSNIENNRRAASIFGSRSGSYPERLLNGAGLQVLGRASIVISNGSSVQHNRCQGCSGGGAGLADHGLLVVSNGSILASNTADLSRSGGGGVFLVERSRLDVQGNSSIANNTAEQGPGGGLALEGSATAIIVGSSIVDNWVSSYSVTGIYGGAGVAMSGNATLKLTNSTIMGNKADAGLGAGILAMNLSTVILANAVRFAGNRLVAGLGRDVAASSTVQLVFGGGVMQDGHPMSKCSSGVHLGIPPCKAGEYVASGVCRCCPVYTYSYTYNASTCEQCPSNSVCAGADSVLPVVGYWHSSPRSVQMHKCPLGAASCGANGTCLGGHTGNLCGACREGYGLWLPLRCSKCLPAPQQLAVYLVLFFGCVGLVAYTVHATLRDNQAGGRDLRPSDLLKVLAQFLQYLVILGSISVPWPAFLSSCFVAATVVFGAASGQSSLDCWLQQTGAGMRLPLAVQRQLVPFLATVAVLVAVVLLLLGLHWLKRLSRVRARNRVRGGWRMPAPKPLQALQRLRVSMLVVAFFAYPTLVKAALSFFACLPIDVAGKQPYPEYAAATHPYGYWVSDIQQECFAGWHKPWALGLGLPAAVVLCVGVPAVLLWFLVANKHMTSDPCFQELYGFLYRNYTDTSRWWEAVWALQTVALTAVSVFHFTLKAYYALLLMGLVLLLSAAVQQAAKPYRHRQLHRLHMAGTCCLYLNTWLALNLFTFEVEGPSLTALHTAVGAIVVAMDAAFVACCVYSILGVAHPGVQAALLKGAEWAKSRALLLPCCVGGN